MSLFCLGTLLLASSAHAQSDAFPVKAIRIVVPFAPGGSADINARLIAPKMGELLGQQIIIDNRAGASGNIGNEIVARAAPDGYTLLLNSMPFVVNLHIFPRVPYHPINDYAPVGMIAASPAAVTVHPSLPARSIKELIALARARPGQLNYASAGVGTNPHIAGELFNIMGKTHLIAVHFKGGGPSLIAATAGEVSISFINIAESSAFIRANRLRGLAVTSPKRLAAFAQLPAVAETLPGYEFVAWFALLAPAKTPRSAITQLNDALRKTLVTPDSARLFNERGLDITPSTPEAASEHLKQEVERWARVVKERGMKAD